MRPHLSRAYCRERITALGNASIPSATPPAPAARVWISLSISPAPLPTHATTCTSSNSMGRQTPCHYWNPSPSWNRNSCASRAGMCASWMPATLEKVTSTTHFASSSWKQPATSTSATRKKSRWRYGISSTPGSARSIPPRARPLQGSSPLP